MTQRTRRGFSSIELVIVVLILANVAAASVPRRYGNAVTSQQFVSRRHLAVLREAIELHRQQFGSYPQPNRLIDAIRPMLDGPFPAPCVGEHAGDPTVYYDPDPDPAISARPDPRHTAGWVYKAVNGSLRINVGANTAAYGW